MTLRLWRPSLSSTEPLQRPSARRNTDPAPLARRFGTRLAGPPLYGGVRASRSALAGASKLESGSTPQVGSAAPELTDQCALRAALAPQATRTPSNGSGRVPPQLREAEVGDAYQKPGGGVRAASGRHRLPPNPLRVAYQEKTRARPRRRMAVQTRSHGQHLSAAWSSRLAQSSQLRSHRA